MVLRKAGVRLTLEGQAEYKAGLADINREQRLLAEQSKLAVAQLGTQASRQQTYTTNMSNYSKQLKVAGDQVNVLKNRQNELPKVQSQIKSSLESTNATYRDSQKETERLKNNYDQMREALGSSHEATKAAKAEYQASKAETKELATEIKGLEKAYNANEKELSNLPFTLNKAEVASQKLRNETQKLHEEYRNAGGRYADLSDELGELEERLTTVGGVMQSTGGFLTKTVTAPILLAGGAAIKASIDFESAMAGVKKTVDELYDANGNLIISYEDLSDGIREMAKNDLPATTTEIAAVAEAAGQLGIHTDNVLAFSRTMIDMGESTNLGSEEAATALARFANITSMNQNKFSNLGSAIVDLGNNFATTEADIVNLAMRLAGAGSQVGMSEADIIGLSAALSSVGIEAEMGGSALSKTLINMSVASATGLDAVRELEIATGTSRRELELMASLDSKGFKSIAGTLNMTTTEMLKIIKAGKNLEGFAEIAGLTGEQFKKAFEEDAVGALGAFIEGLGSAEEKGTTAIELLDELGISEVRLRDSLLRAGNASELFATAVDQSNTAFDENIALTEEAEKRYETTESKLRMLKNQVSDVAIEFGGPLVDALRDGMEAARPLIERLSEMGESFSNLDEDTQRTIIKWGLFAIAGGPVLSMLGNITSGVGTLTGGMGDLVKWYGKISTPKMVGDITGSFGAVAGGAGTAATKIGGLTTLIGAVPAVLGIAGAALLGYTAWKVWGEEAWKSAERVREWGFDVDETVASTLTEIKGFGDDAQGQFSLMSQGLSGNTEEMGANFANMGEVIESSLNERIANLDSLIENLPDTVRTALTKLLEEDKKQAEQSLAIIEENNAEIAKIRQDASDYERDLTIHDATRIRAIQQESNEAYINSLKVSDDEKRQLLDAMNGDVESASREQAESWVKGLAEQRKAQNDHYNTNKNEYRNHLEEMGYSSDAIAEHMRVWELAQKSATDGIDQQLAMLAKKYPELAEIISFETGQLINSNNRNSETWLAGNQRIIESAKDLSDQVTANAQRNADALAWQTDGTEKFEKAWADIVLDDATAEIKTNVREAIVEAGASNEQWNNMKFMLHNAELDSNAKQMIGEAAIVNGYWDGMAWEDKEVILKDEFSITMFKALEESAKWEELPLEAKTALMYSNTPEIMAQTMLDLGLWEDFLPAIKELDADNFAVLDAISKSETALLQYEALEPELKRLLAEDPATLTYDQSRKALEQYENLEPELKKLLGDNQQVQDKVKVATDKLNHWNTFHIKARHLPLETNAISVSEAAQRAINRVTGKVVEVETIYTSTNLGGMTGGPTATWAAGTNYHPGGDMIVNDQRGPLFKELITYPDGTSFVPEGRNVLIPNAPRGAKVLKAALTKDLIPRYEKGIGFNSQSMQSLVSQPVININVNNPVVREDADIDKISSAVVDKMTRQAQLSNLFNRGKGGAYA